MGRVTILDKREIAARLRALPDDMYAEIRKWEEDGLFIEPSVWDEADYSQIHNVVFGCFPADYMNSGDYKELHNGLADLIKPELECDREGLLALADEYEEKANKAAEEYENATWPFYKAGMFMAYELAYSDAASRIRELCGVVDDE